MNCKNCNKALRTDYLFCPSCGAKIIRRRLTISHLLEDFKDRFLNIDNTLLRTLRHMTTKPEVVILDYINGVRGKYLNPVSYITLTLAFVVANYYVQATFFPDILTVSDMMNLDSSKNPAFDQMMAENMENFLQFTIDNIYLLTFATIPFLALTSKVIFWKMKDLNYSEHIVLNTYAYSHAYILTTLMSLASLWNKEVFYWSSVMASLLMILYYAFTMKRVFDLSFVGILARTLLFFAFGAVLYVALILIMILIIFLNPELRESFIPKESAILLNLPQYFLV